MNLQDDPTRPDGGELNREQAEGPPSSRNFLYLAGRKLALERAHALLDDYRGLSRRIACVLERGIGRTRRVALRRILEGSERPPADAEEQELFDRGYREEMVTVVLDLEIYRDNWAVRLVSDTLSGAEVAWTQDGPSSGLNLSTRAAIAFLLGEEGLPAARRCRSYEEARLYLKTWGYTEVADGIGLDDPSLQTEVLDELVADVPEASLDGEEPPGA